MPFPLLSRSRRAVDRHAPTQRSTRQRSAPRPPRLERLEDRTLLSGWVGDFGSSASGFARGVGVAVDALGNVYVSGNFQGTVDFDPGAATTNLTSVGGWDSFLSKFAPDGTFQWARRLGGSGTELGREHVAIDGSGNVYLASGLTGNGSITGTGGFPTVTLTGRGTKDVLVSKFDSNGTLAWLQQIGQAGATVEVFNIAVNTTPTEVQIFLTGQHATTLDFNPGTGVDTVACYGQTDIYVTKLVDSGGTTPSYAWTRRAGGRLSSDSHYEGGYGITADASGNVYVTGTFDDVADFGALSVTARGREDAFVTKLDSAGTFLWVRRMGGEIATTIPRVWKDRGDGIALYQNFVYVTGWFETDGRPADFGNQAVNPNDVVTQFTTMGFQTTANVYGDHDIFVAKLEDVGTTANFVWTKRLGGPEIDHGSSLAVDGAGAIYTTGYCSAGDYPTGITIDFDPGPGTALLTSRGAGPHSYLSKLDALGNFVSARRLGGSASTASSSNGYAITVDAAGTIYTVGQFDGTAEFDLGDSIVTRTGTQDAFVSKLEQTHGAILGRVLVHHPSDATTPDFPLGGATITLTGNGLSRSTTTGPVGEYLFANLPAGTYTLQQGTNTLPAITIGTGQFVTEQNLIVALATEPVTVSNTTAKAIRDATGGNPSTTTSTITVAGSYTIYDVNVTLNISHPNREDLEVILISPTGTRVVLFRSVGGTGDHFSNTTLDDQASTRITATTNFTGSFSPRELLSALNGENVNGTWTLEITDHLRTNKGTLNSWSLTFRRQSGAPLQADSTGPGSTEVLSHTQVQPLLAEAIARWQAAGGDRSALDRIEVHITNLGGTTLGLAWGNTIWLDDDAAGWGWFVDATPSDDSEFTTPGDQGEQGRMDLLSVLMHELGHRLGHDHEEEGVMVESLQPGMRLLSLLHEESGKSTDPLQVAMPPVELAQLLTEARPSAALAATPALRLGIDQVRPEALLTPPAHTAVAGTAPPVRKPAAEVEAVDWLFAQENGLFLSPLEAALLDQR